MDKTLDYIKEIIVSTQALSERIDKLHEVEMDEEIELSTVNRRKLAKMYEQTTEFLKTLQALQYQYQAREKERMARQRAKKPFKKTK